MTAAEELDLLREKRARRRAQLSLLDFTKYTHPHWTIGTHHRQICLALEAVERGEIKRLLIEAPPRHSKSELSSRSFPAWFIGRNPRKQIITASYNDLLATDIGRDVRNLVGSGEYRNVFKGVDLAEDSAAAGRWHTNHGGSYLATGVGGTLTGYGADVFIIDDPLKNREEAESERIRDNLWHWFTSTAYTRLMPGGAMVLIMTRWHEDDLAAQVQRSEKWHVLKLPAISNEGTPNERALWPEWYPLEELHKIRAVLPPRDWQALYQQEPRAEQGGYIQRGWFDTRHAGWHGCVPGCDTSHKHEPGTIDGKRPNIYIASDFAVTEAREGKDPDYTEHGVFGAVDDKLYVLDWWHGQVTSNVWIEELLNLFAKWKPVAWFGEGGVIRHAIEPFLTRRMVERRVYAQVEWLNPIKDKATHGRAFQARAAMGRIEFPSTVWAERVISQCVGFPGAQHDDAFDAMGKMCRAIDEAHPAITGKPKDTKQTSKWDKAFKGKPPNAWKVS